LGSGAGLALRRSPNSAIIAIVLLGLGKHLLLRELDRGGWVVIIAIVAILLLVRFWSPLLERIERWWRSR
jgi:membrane-bound ClpP family serine protease